MRYCGRCNRPLTPEFHDQERRIVGRGPKGQPFYAPDAPPQVVGFIEGHPVFADAEPTPRMRYTCRVTLVATSPVSGKHFPVNHPQSTEQVPVSWVHNDRLELG